MNSTIRPENENFTLLDIFLNKKVFKNFIIVTFLLNCIVVPITNFYLILIEGCTVENSLMLIFTCTNFTSICISALLAIGVILLFEKKLRGWLMQTRGGNTLLSILTLISGIITIAVMCGINSLWIPAEEVAESFRDDAYMGMLIPFDISTIIFALITFSLWNTTRKCTFCHKIFIHTGILLAVISVIISFTPLQLVIQALLLTAIRGTEVLKM